MNRVFHGFNTAIYTAFAFAAVTLSQVILAPSLIFSWPSALLFGAFLAATAFITCPLFADESAVKPEAKPETAPAAQTIKTQAPEATPKKEQTANPEPVVVNQQSAAFFDAKKMPEAQATQQADKTAATVPAPSSH